MKKGLLLTALALSGILLVACQSEKVNQDTEVPAEVVEDEVTPIVTKTGVEESEVAEATRQVTATEPEIVEVTVTPEEPEAVADPVTFDGYSTTAIPTLDPQSGEDAVSIDFIENLFVNLTNYDPETAEIVPEAATSWEISDDGLTYTFHIRTDIPWVYHNPATGATTQAADEAGNPRFVTAHDFAFGIKRACDPHSGSYYSTVIAPPIKGCSDVLNAEEPENIPEELRDAIGVSAPDAATLVIELEFPAGYFLSMTSMWTLAAVPRWTIAEFGDNWIEAGHIVTNGRYLLREWVHNVRLTLIRNPLMPADMRGGGNIERFVTQIVPDISAGYASWRNNEVDISTVPPEEIQTFLADYPDETDQIGDGPRVFYFGFRMTKPPFDNVHLRRAFSAAFDRASFVAEVRQGQGLPMRHFAPPGIFGAPPTNEVGVGYDPEFARAQLAEAGYPDCEGLPRVTLFSFGDPSTLNWIEFAQAQWLENLGCGPGVINVEHRSARELLAATSGDTPDEEAPHMWALGWRADYPDENNWVGEVLWCQNPENRPKRACNEIDDLVIEAREETNPARRIELYRQIEESFFGPEGEFPIAPLYMPTAFSARHTWVDRVPAFFGGAPWYAWTLDWKVKLAAQE